MKKNIVSLVLTVLVVLGSGWGVHAGVLSEDLDARLKTLSPSDEVNIIVYFTDKVDPSKIKGKDKKELRTKLVESLQARAAATQPAHLAFLEAQGARNIRPFWIFNGVAATARAQVVQAFSKRPGVERISLDGLLKAPVPVETTAAPSEWNLGLIKAPDLWSLGFTGSGIVVAGMDTGVDYRHADLSDRWRGGSNSWYDPHGEHALPYDKAGHGTQVMGIMVGGAATGTSIGVAPGAKWIAVKIFNDAGVAGWSDIHAGFQWLLDPDRNPATHDAPDVVNNSWGFNDRINQCVTEFQADIAALKAAEIAVVFSAGNAGPLSSTSMSPGNYPESFAVGAVDESTGIAGFSSRGPSACGGAIYPQVMTPGVNVKTSDLTFGFLTDSFAYLSGTSFAAPHVSGAMALLLSAFPNVTVAHLQRSLTESALDLGAIGPDNNSGYGLMDVFDAYSILASILSQCTDSDGDGYFAEGDCGPARDCDDSNASIYPGAAEVKFDGVDQDCNGYDLTIQIVEATYSIKRATLSVKATSGLGATAELTLVGYGRMTWNRKTSRWEISVRENTKPDKITVSGIEGSAMATVK
jgi:bacillopeptidase F